MQKVSQFVPGGRPVVAAKSLEAYPDYSRSLLHQRWRNPTRQGLTTGAGSGAIGAALAVVLARLLKADAKQTALAGGAGGAAGGLLGFVQGRNAAESENSRLLFMRRRLGVNEPGEYEALLRFPERPLGAIERKPKKPKPVADAAPVEETAVEEESEKAAAFNPGALLRGAGRGIRGSWRPMAGGLAGAGVGYYGLPAFGGYSDVPTARAASALENAGLGAWLAMKGRGKVDPRMLGLVGLGELVPFGLTAMSRGADASKAMAGALTTLGSSHKSLAEGQAANALRSFLSSGAGRGMGIGAVAAGAGGLVSGLTRAQTDQEIESGRSRASMVGKDFLKFLIPALAAGGALGSLADTSGQR